jgi:hypothetical protein
MSNKSMHYKIGDTQLVNPAVYKTAQTSAVFDRSADGGIGAPYESLELLLSKGLWTDGAHSWVIKEADDDGSGNPGTFSTVATTDLQPSGGFTSVTDATNDNGSQRVAYVGAKQYVEVVSAETGTTGLLWGLVALPGNPRNLPTVASGS